MLDLSVVILVGQEELHIKRCLEKLAPLAPRQVFVVESQTGDRTHEVAIATAQRLQWRSEKCEVRSEKLNKEGKPPQLLTTHSSLLTAHCSLLTSHFSLLTAHCSLLTVFRPWPGNQAAQFNWALDNLPIEGEWVLRLDADEYFLPEAIEEIIEKLPTLPADVTGVISKRRHYIFGGWAKHGTYPVKLLRIFRKGKGVCEERYMDEHIELSEGRAVEFDFDFVDHNLNSFEWWKEKHRGYAKREAMDAMEILADIRSGRTKQIHITGQAAAKRAKKYAYYRLPPYFRAFAYFCIRYFLKLGFLDGRTGWMWNYWQGLWYRLLVDREISRR